MKLVLDKKWKWAAMDINGEWFFHTSKPESGLTEWASEKATFAELFEIKTPHLDWRASLHEIIHHQDGTASLRKHVDVPGDGEPVMVWDTANPQERRYYSTGTIDMNGKLRCYASGRSKWTAHDRIANIASFGNWRRPTPEELA